MLRLLLASRDAGSKLLRDASDPYVQLLCDREMNARMKRVCTSKDQFSAHQSSCVLDWSDRDKEEMSVHVPVMEKALERFAPAVLEVLGADTTSLFLTSGAEETGLSSGPKSRIAYCRRSRFVFFSRAYFNWENPEAVKVGKQVVQV